MRGGLGENVRMAMDTIRANKLRSSLTTLAIVIAITAIVVVSSVVNGLNGAVRSQVSEMGSNLIWVFRFDVFQFGRPSEELRTRRCPLPSKKRKKASRISSPVRGCAPLQNFCLLCVSLT